MLLKALMTTYQQRIESVFDTYLPHHIQPVRLHEAMRYPHILWLLEK